MLLRTQGAHFVSHLFACPDVPPPSAPPSTTQTPRLDHFIAYALHRTLLFRLAPFCLSGRPPSICTAFYHSNSAARPFHRLRLAPHAAFSSRTFCLSGRPP